MALEKQLSPGEGHFDGKKIKRQVLQMLYKEELSFSIMLTQTAH